jgi:hypothetical protein
MTLLEFIKPIFSVIPSNGFTTTTFTKRLFAIIVNYFSNFFPTYVVGLAIMKRNTYVFIVFLLT